MSVGEGIRQLSRTRWSVRVKRVDRATGKVVNRKATIEGSKADAVRKRDAMRAELERGRGERRRARLLEFALAWIASRAIKASTRDKYNAAMKHIGQHLGSVYLDAVAPSDVAAYVALRLAVAAGNTVLNELRLLRAIARDSIAEGLAERDWCARIKAPRVSHYTDERPNLLTPEQGRRVLARVPRQWLGLVHLLITTGLRIGEATALRWEDVEFDAGRDFDAGIAHVRRRNYKGTIDEPKTKASIRTVPVLPEIVELWGLRRDTGLIFATRSGDMYRGSPLRSVLARACAAAGVPRVTTHGLRRTFNNDGRKLGEREVLKAITGHDTDEMVEHYSHVDQGEKASLSRAVAVRMGVLDVSAAAAPNGAK